MQIAGPGPAGMPWRRLWPAAAGVVALHATALVGWPVTLTDLQATHRSVASTMLVRTLPDARVEAALLRPSPVTTSPPPDPVPTAVARPQAAGPRAGPASEPSRTPAPEYRAVGLEPGPKPLGDIDPVYPAEAGQQAGSVVLRLLVGADGKVDGVSVVRSSPKGLFDRSAVEAFRAAPFSPGLFLGVPVKSQITIEVEFTPINRGATVSPPTY